MVLYSPHYLYWNISLIHIMEPIVVASVILINISAKSAWISTEYVTNESSQKLSFSYSRALANWSAKTLADRVEFQPLRISSPARSAKTLADRLSLIT